MPVNTSILGGLSNAAANGLSHIIRPSTTPGISPSTIAKNLKENTTIETFAFPSDIPKYYINLVVANYKRDGFLALGQLTPIGNIVLPLPAQLIDAHNIAYEETAIGAFIGNAA